MEGKTKPLDFSLIFRKILDSLNLTYYRVGKDTGISSTTWGKILNGEVKPKYETLRALLDAYPQLNANYVLNGVGKMLNDGNLKRIADDEYMDLPFLSVKAKATFLSNYEEGLTTITETYSVNSKQVNKNKTSIVVEVDGDSMLPTLRHGSRIVCEKIDCSEWAYTTGVVAVLYRDYFVVKRIKNNDLHNLKNIMLHSDNINSDGAIVVEANDIREIWKVRLICYMSLD